MGVTHQITYLPICGCASGGDEPISDEPEAEADKPDVGSDESRVAGNPDGDLEDEGGP